MLIVFTYKTIYAGMAATLSEGHASAVAIAIRDTTYLLDFIEERLEPKEGSDAASSLTGFIISRLKAYAENHLEKIIGIAMPCHIADDCPLLCSRLWAELDIVPLVLPETSMRDHFPSKEGSHPEPESTQDVDPKSLDEQAESMSRKCVRCVARSRTYQDTSNRDPDFLALKTSLCYKLVSAVSLRLILPFMCNLQPWMTSRKLSHLRHGLQWSLMPMT